MENLMNNKWKRFALATIVMLFVAGVASAKFPRLTKSTNKSADIEIQQGARLGNGPDLQPGSYKLTLVNNSNSPEAAFYRKGKLVAQVPVQLVDGEKKSNETEIYSDTDTHTITEMHPKGWNQKLVFIEAGTATNSGQ
jgi:hypothetical protein